MFKKIINHLKSPAYSTYNIVDKTLEIDNSKIAQKANILMEQEYKKICNEIINEMLGLGIQRMREGYGCLKKAFEYDEHKQKAIWWGKDIIIEQLKKEGYIVWVIRDDGFFSDGTCYIQIKWDGNKPFISESINYEM